MSRSQASRTTLLAVAEAAGVSVATVSKVVNDRSDVAPATRARVAALLAEYNYVARGQSTQVTGLDLAFDSMDNPNNLEMIRGATAEAAAEDVEVVVGVAPRLDDTARWARWAQRVAGPGRAGLILVTTRLTPAHYEPFARVGARIVLVDPVSVPHSGLPSIGVTDFAGGLAATEHLLGLGHRRIAMIQGRPEAASSRARLHGYQAALSTAGIAVDPDLIERGDFLIGPSRMAALRLLDLAEPPTAVFAASDGQALGVIEAARQRGLRVPEDLSVVGFDGVPVLQYSSPPLTTVRQPFAEMGRAAVQSLLRLASGRDLASRHVELATELIVRASCAPPPALPPVPPTSATPSTPTPPTPTPTPTPKP
ncbi:LacI family DNA-binding transcriptional regulator [Catenulispora yoronensis]|uniref:LacI family DNA-binding transcriptional regulator n=1 Tax=Catenulispora yoronensis TaxID=450799 RepID=A0ABP5FHY5_9ACTN